MIVAPVAGAAAIPASTEAGDRHVADASVLELAGAGKTAATFSASVNW